jgi:outer membrane lipoprotein-sorting protein
MPEMFLKFSALYLRCAGPVGVPSLCRTTTMKRILILSLLLTLAHAQDIRSGESLLRAMHDRYQSSWYPTVTFTQKSTTYNPDGTNSAETWYEAASVPGKLRIDIGTPSDGNGLVLVDGTVTILKNNQITGSRPRVNMLLVLGFDVNRQDPETTIKVVKGEGFDLSKLHEDTWEGKPAYVVGADKGDLKSRQFWIAKDTLLFERVIEPSSRDATKLSDIRFTSYQPLARAWIAARVEVYSDDKMVFTEDYTDIQANVKLAPEVFDPRQFAATHWEKP